MTRKLKDTRLGLWLSDKAPDLLAVLGDIVPDAGLLSFLSSQMQAGSLSKEEAAEFNRLASEERARLAAEVSRRWEADAKGDSSLAKVVRPLCLLLTLVGFFGVLIADSVEGNGFTLDSYLAEVLEVMALTIFGAYFAGRSLEKSVKR